jgi:tripartite ATP-independent transporter DctP family solute receptor
MASTIRMIRQVTVAAIGLAIISLGGGQQADAADKTMRFGHMWPASSGWGQAAQHFADLVKERSGGKLEIRVYPDGQLGSERENEEGLQVGNLDVTFGGPGVLTNFDPKIGIFDMPFMFRDYAQANAVMDGPIGAKVFESLRSHAGIRVLASGAQGFRYILTKKPINSIADLKNAKIRVPEAETFLRTFQLIGANPVSVPWGETYMAAQSGVVDGLEGVPEVLVNFKMYEVAKNAATTNHILATLQLMVSDKVYQGLPADMQKIVDAAAKEAWNTQRDAAQKGNEQAEAQLEKLGVKFTSPDLKPFQAAVKPFWSDWAAKTGSTDIIESIQKL